MNPRLAKKEAEWQAVRYAIDMIDIAWTYDHVDPEKYPALYTESHAAMKRHRETLCQLQTDILKTIRAYKEIAN